MGLHSTCERQQTDRHVSDMLMEVVPTLCEHSIGSFIEQTQDDGDIVGRKTPEDILFSTDLTQVQSV